MVDKKNESVRKALRRAERAKRREEEGSQYVTSDEELDDDSSDFDSSDFDSNMETEN